MPKPIPPYSPRTLLLTSALIALLGGCSAPDESSSEAASAPVPLVVAQQVVRESWTDSLEMTTEIAPWAAVTVAAETAGRIIDLPLDHGDTVVAGDSLCRLDPADAQAEIARNSARLASANAGLRQAKTDLERGRALRDRDQIISQDHLEQLALALETAEARVAEAEAELRISRERLADTSVRAPFDGVISSREVELGAWVAAGDPIIRLVDRQRLKARSFATARDRMKLDVGNTVSIRVDGDGQQDTHLGTIRYVGQEADPATGTFLIEAEVDPGDGLTNGTGILLPGLRGHMSIDLASKNGLVLPRTAVVSGRSHSHVFVLDQELVVERRVVTVRSIDSQRVEVESGLEEDEVVVVEGQHSLSGGDRVELRER